MTVTRARDNPFRTERVLEVRYRPIGRTWESLLSRLADLNYRAAIVGPQGTGKTTLLEDLAHHLERLGFTVRFQRLDRESPRLSDEALHRLTTGLGTQDVILLDGCEQLRPRASRAFLRLTRPARGLVITTHKPGRLPTLVECRTNAALLEGIVRDLIDPDAADTIDCRSLLHRHDGNIRNALRELYDTHSALP